MGQFQILQGTVEEINTELNVLDETNHVKIVSSNSVVTKENDIISIVYVYCKSRTKTNLNISTNELIL